MDPLKEPAPWNSFWRKRGLGIVHRLLTNTLQDGIIKYQSPPDSRARGVVRPTFAKLQSELFIRLDLPTSSLNHFYWKRLSGHFWMIFLKPQQNKIIVKWKLVLIFQIGQLWNKHMFWLPVLESKYTKIIESLWHYLQIYLLTILFRPAAFQLLTHKRYNVLNL